MVVYFDFSIDYCGLFLYAFKLVTFARFVQIGYLKNYRSTHLQKFNMDKKVQVSNSAQIAQNGLLAAVSKGDYNAECYRTACNNSKAVYYNHSTRKHYCRSCAMLLNQVNKADALRLFGHDLCTLSNGG